MAQSLQLVYCLKLQLLFRLRSVYLDSFREQVRHHDTVESPLLTCYAPCPKKLVVNFVE